MSKYINNNHILLHVHTSNCILISKEHINTLLDIFSKCTLVDLNYDGDIIKMESIKPGNITLRFIPEEQLAKHVVGKALLEKEEVSN